MHTKEHEKRGKKHFSEFLVYGMCTVQQQRVCLQQRDILTFRSVFIRQRELLM